MLLGKSIRPVRRVAHLEQDGRIRRLAGRGQIEECGNVEVGPALVDDLFQFVVRILDHFEGAGVERRRLGYAAGQFLSPSHVCSIGVSEILRQRLRKGVDHESSLDRSVPPSSSSAVLSACTGSTRQFRTASGKMRRRFLFQGGSERARIMRLSPFTLTITLHTHSERRPDRTERASGSIETSGK